MWIESILQKYMAKELSFHFAYCATDKYPDLLQTLFFRQFDAKVKFYSPINFEVT